MVKIGTYELEVDDSITEKYESLRLSDLQSNGEHIKEKRIKVWRNIVCVYSENWRMRRMMKKHWKN